MRTTLTIDDDLAEILQRRALELGLPFKEVVNRTLREGIKGTPGSSSKRKIKTRPHSFGFKPGIDLEKLNQLVDELEVKEFARKIESR
jgi:hypothetical protein